jgi:uncharacterized protein YjgD (DUF1641 family)
MGITLPPPGTTAQEQLLARLSEDKTVDALNRLLDRLEVIAFVAEALDGFLGRANVVADSVASSMADLKKLAGDAGTAEVVGAIPKLAKAGAQFADATDTPAFKRLAESGLLEKLGDEKTITNLKALIERLELAVFTLEALDGWLRRGEDIAQAMAEGVGDVRKAMPTIDGAKVREVLTALPPLVEAGKTLIASGMLEPKTVAVLGAVGRSAALSFDEAKSHKHPPRQLGLFALLRELKDPDIARALDFLLRVAKAYGQTLK